MGMDVNGKKPTAKVGKYFRNNCWWWRPLARYCCQVAPDVTAKCQYWQSNDGDGLGARDSKKLAAVLHKELKSGRTKEFADGYAMALAAMPDEPCDLCGATGIRKPIPARGAGDPKNGGFKCNACDGTGKRRPWATEYPFSVENVQEFVEFLEHCGGFRIC